jgi:dolichyl-phosphate beta-glucosyltransferase
MNDGPSTPLDLSVVIPAFDEAGRIGASVASVCEYLDRQRWTWELVVVLDGGRPSAAEEVAPVAARRSNVRVLDNHVNRGKGFSVRRGVLAANGRYRIFLDADLSLPIDGTAAMIGLLEEGADVVIGSRTVEGSEVRGDRARLRQTLGWAFNRLVRLLAAPHIGDTQCGFKGFRDDVAKRVFRVARIERFGFDVEVLWIARKLGYRITEMPVTCTYHSSSSVRRLSDGATMIADLLRVRWSDFTGQYDRPTDQGPAS